MLERTNYPNSRLDYFRVRYVRVSDVYFADVNFDFQPMTGLQARSKESREEKSLFDPDLAASRNSSSLDLLNTIHATLNY